MSRYKTPTNKMSNNKTSKITHHPKTKRPNNDNKDERSPNLQNVQCYEMSKATKCSKLQNV